MPGILGIVGKPENVFQEMLRRSRLQAWYAQTADGISLGEARADFAQTDLEAGTPVAKTPDGKVAVAVCGEIFHVGGLTETLAKDASPAEIILAGFLAEGKAFFERIDGRFHAAIFDAANRRVILTCDRFGTRPLYWTQTPRHFLFAPEIKTLLADEAVSRKENVRALADFFTFGHYLGEETSLEAVSVLPPAAWYVYSAEERTLTRDVYWRPSPAVSAGAERVCVEEIADAFHTAVLRQSDDTPHLGISLSGGLDARSILGMIRHPENVTSVALGVPGSADHHLATQLAKLAGTTHFNYELNTDFLANYEAQQAEMVRLTDGQYLSSSIVIPTLPFYHEKGIRTLLRGHAGELMHMTKAYAFSLTHAELTKLNTPDAVFTWASSHLQAYMLDGVNTPLLRGVSLSDFKNFAQESLRKSLADANVAENAPAVQTLWPLYLRMRVFREIPLSMRKFDSQVNIRMPFLDNRLVDLLLAAAPEMKMAETLQMAILKKYRPDFLRVKNVNTGTYIGAGFLRQKFAGLMDKIYEKLGLPGYQPYEKMGLWLRRELAPTVKSLLLDERNLDAGIFDPDTVRRVVEGHFAGSNHTYLILAMMISCQRRRFFEGSF